MLESKHMAHLVEEDREEVNLAGRGTVARGDFCGSPNDDPKFFIPARGGIDEPDVAGCVLIDPNRVPGCPAEIGPWEIGDVEVDPFEPGEVQRGPRRLGPPRYRLSDKRPKQPVRQRLRRNLSDDSRTLRPKCRDDGNSNGIGAICGVVRDTVPFNRSKRSAQGAIDHELEAITRGWREAVYQHHAERAIECCLTRDCKSAELAGAGPSQLDIEDAVIVLLVVGRDRERATGSN